MSEKENMITVLYIKVGERPILRKIEDNLEEMQNLVGGAIQYYPFEDVAIICNRDGKDIGLSLNRAVYDNGELIEIIAGDFFICAAPADSDSFKDLPKEQVEKYKEQFKYPEKFTLTPEGIRVEKDKRVKNRERER